MELPFDVTARFGCPSCDYVGPCVGKLDKDSWGDFHDAVLQLTDCSALARGLKSAFEDKSLPAIQSSGDTVYLLAEGCDILGFARFSKRPIMVNSDLVTVGGAFSSQPGDAQPQESVNQLQPKPSSGGYATFQSKLQEIHPLCLLDFYIIEGFQHRGLGKLLFEGALAGEGVAEAAMLAYSHPSEAMFSFLLKHYRLAGGRMASTYFLFDSFFQESKALPGVKVLHKIGVATRASEKEAIAADTRVEDGCCACVDPLASYLRDEAHFYSQRSKLYCFHENMWQDAGAGRVVMLKNKTTGKVRLIFVQEGSNQVVTNHFVVNRAPFCELQRHVAGNDKTWMWTAQERVLEHRFALKFKTSEEASSFWEFFERARQLCPAEDEVIEYAIVRKVGATEASDVKSRHVRLLRVGAVVRVAEVLYFADQKRVRARLVEPEGWITILSHGPLDAGSYAVGRKDLENYTKKVTLAGNA